MSESLSATASRARNTFALSATSRIRDERENAIRIRMAGVRRKLRRFYEFPLRSPIVRNLAVAYATYGYSLGEKRGFCQVDRFHESLERVRFYRSRSRFASRWNQISRHARNNRESFRDHRNADDLRSFNHSLLWRLRGSGSTDVKSACCRAAKRGLSATRHDINRHAH